MSYFGAFGGGGGGGYGGWPQQQQQQEEAYEEEEDEEEQGHGKGNALPVWGNEKSMNLNHLILTNIQGSLYFRSNLFELKTYHEVVDEIYYKVTHLEPWEKGSRKTTGQTGMCGGVRGVGTGGIVSSCFCILYKLFTLKLTRKQLNGLINHRDSPYIRGLGFMFIRYCQPPADMWDWFEPYLNDEEEIDVKAGGGNVICVGEMVRQFLTKLDWYAALFPRIPVPIQKQIDAKLKEVGPFRREGQGEEEEMEEEQPKQQAGADNYRQSGRGNDHRPPPPADVTRALKDVSPSRGGESSRRDGGGGGGGGRDSRRRGSRSRSRSRGGDRRRSRSREGRKRSSSRDRRRSSSRDRHHHHHKRSHKHHGSSSSGGKHRDDDHREHRNGGGSKGDFGDELNREKERQKRDKDRRRSRSDDRRKRSRDRSGERKRSRSRDRSGGRKSKGRSRDRSRDRKDRR